MTREEIRKVVREYATGDYSHLIIYSDHWDYTCGVVPVECGEDVNRKISKIKAGGSPGMFSIEEVYNYSLDIESQLNEKRAYHIDAIVDKPRVTNKVENMHISDNLKHAISYAISKHDGQERMDGSPYIKHPLNVLKNVMKYKESKSLETLLIAACLHDTLEDTDTSYYDLINEFGLQVASLVLELTTDEDMKNVLGKEKYLAIKMKNMSSWALVIKLCDRLDNICDMVSASDEFKDRYASETIGIIDYLLRNRNLSKTHITIIEQIIKTLFELCKGDVEKAAKLIEVAGLCSTKKEQDKTTSSTEILQSIANSFNGTSGDILKRLFC